MSSFRKLVDSKPDYFIGTITETEESLKQVELDLDIHLPEELK